MHCAHRNPFVHHFFDSAMIITDSAVHEVDITRWLLGEEIVRVDRAHAARRRAARARACRTRSCRVRDRVRPVVDVEAFVSAGYGYDIRCEVVGETGTLELPRALATRFSGPLCDRVPTRA